MRIMATIPLLVLAALIGAAGPSAAETIRADQPDSVVRALQSAGYRAALKTDEVGDPMIESASSGKEFAVFFYGCKNNAACSSVQFFAGYGKKASLEHLNAWNRDNRFGRAYRADNEFSRIEMDVDLDDGGMSEALFHDNLEYWAVVMAAFEKHIAD